MLPIKICSIQTGTVVSEGDRETRDVRDCWWKSAFRKTAVDGPVEVGREGIRGDQVADTKHHGGPDKALLCYPAIHYEAWRTEHPELPFAAGGFGENLTLADVTERDLCVGDRLRTSQCVFEVSQPRQPCWKIARRWKTKTLTKEVTQTGRTGWYLRVREPGVLEAGERLELIERPNSSWPIARANDVLFGREVDRLAVIELMNLSQLADDWKSSLG
jgi:MOSC domain-containing protein YiiM